ncbi:MAG TPA: tripartite tricarboxylate transporter substrate binding protein [Burkholderiales bacterium]|nr:tripartite tricarboxylate transporter substrate binding protein [Burkholderiales bacterium]
MKNSRRSLLRRAAALAALPMLAGLARAQSYPGHPVRIVVGYAPGGSTDILARRMGQWLSERLGQQFFVENRAGAGSNLGTEAVVSAAPDGHTLLLVTPANLINAALYPSLKFNFERDIAPVVLMTREPNAMVVHPSVPAKSLAEFIAYAKANAGKIAMASGGNGASSHISGEMFKMLAGVDMVHVPYKGAGPALTAVVGGQAQLYFSPLSATLSYVKQGQLRMLAVTTDKRSALMPDIPAIGEQVSGYEASQLYGIGAPRATPAEIIDKLNREVNAVLAEPEAKARLAELGMTPVGGSAAEFRRVIADETEKWGKVVRFSGARID